MVQVCSHDRQRHIDVGVITFARVSTARPWQNGQFVGRVTGASKNASDPTAELSKRDKAR